MNRFLKLLAFVLLLYGITFFTGCAEVAKPVKLKETENFKVLNRVSYPDIKADVQPVSEETVAALQEFTFLMVREVFSEEGKNHVYSPLSLYMALSMLLEGVSDEEAKGELEGLLGLERTQNRVAMKTVYENNFYKNQKGTLKLANSIWFRKDYPVEAEFLRILAEEYYAEGYQTLFDSEGHQKIIDWINYYTENFLELTKDKFDVPRDTVLLLLNTIYFKNKWKVRFDEDLTRLEAFNAPSGQVTVDFMRHSVDGKFKLYEGYMVGEDYFENNASITYILPLEGTASSDLLDPDVLRKALDPADKENQKIQFIVPKFKYFSEYQLKEPLEALGVRKVFDSLSRSLELMSRDGSLFVSALKQNAGIEFSEAGVKAAAVTGIIIRETAMEEVLFPLNRPFVYIIKDAFGIPLFIGLVQNPLA